MEPSKQPDQPEPKKVTPDQLRQFEKGEVLRVRHKSLGMVWVTITHLFGNDFWDEAVLSLLPGSGTAKHLHHPHVLYVGALRACAV